MRRLLDSRIIGATVVGIVAATIAVLMGLWQWNSWQEHRNTVQENQTQLKPQPLPDVMGPDAPFMSADVGKPVTLIGRWLPESTLFISGRAKGETRGYWVMTPLAIDATGSAIPVVRGWTPDPKAAPAPPTGSARLTGWLQPPEGTGEMDTDPGDDVLPQLRMADLVQYVDQDLYGAYVVLNHDAVEASGTNNPGDQGLEQATLDELPPAPRETGLRNFLYALEWFVFAGFAVFMWWRWCADILRGKRDQPSVASGPATANHATGDPAPDSAAQASTGPKESSEAGQLGERG